MKDSIWADALRQVPRQEAERIATHEVRGGRLLNLRGQAVGEDFHDDRPPGEKR